MPINTWAAQQALPHGGTDVFPFSLRPSGTCDASQLRPTLPRCAARSRRSLAISLWCMRGSSTCSKLPPRTHLHRKGGTHSEQVQANNVTIQRMRRACARNGVNQEPCSNTSLTIRRCFGVRRLCSVSATSGIVHPITVRGVLPDNSASRPHHHHHHQAFVSGEFARNETRGQNLEVAMSVNGELVGATSARRRRERRLRSWWRHEQLSVAAALATARHHSAGPGVVTRREGQQQEVEVEQHDGLRAQTTPPPGTRPGVPLDPGPPVVGRWRRSGRVGVGVPGPADVAGALEGGGRGCGGGRVGGVGGESGQGRGAHCGGD